MLTSDPAVVADFSRVEERSIDPGQLALAPLLAGVDEMGVPEGAEQTWGIPYIVC